MGLRAAPRNPSKILFPTPGSILQIEGSRWEAAHQKSTEATCQNLGGWGAQQPFPGLEAMPQGKQLLRHHSGPDTSA